MDKERNHGGTYPVDETEDERCPPLREVALDGQWDDVASDTESLAQDRASQQQQQMQIGRHNHTKSHLSEKENADCLQYENEEENDTGDENDEALQLYDSLDKAACSQDTKWQMQMGDLETDARKRTSQLHSDDEYSDLRYDPNWRTNLRLAGCFNQSPCMSVEKSHQNPKRGEPGRRETLLLKGGYRYITDTSPAPVAPPHMAADKAEHSYHLHPQRDQSSSTVPRCSLNHAQQLGTMDVELSRSISSSTPNKHESTWQHITCARRESECDVAAENFGRSHKLSEGIKGVQVRDCQADHEQEKRPLQGQKIEARPKGPPSLTSHKVSLDKSQRHPMESVVQRNKKTLGHSTKCGSYVKLHGLKQASDNMMHATVEETSSSGGPEESSAHELALLQTTKQLKVTQISKRKKGQQRKHPNSPRQQQPHGPEVTAEREDCLSFPLAKSDTLTEPESPCQTSSQLLPPAINLNIHFNNPPQFLPLRQQTSQDLIINLASLHGQTFWQSASRLALSPEYQSANQEGVNVACPHQKGEASPHHWQSITSLKWPFTCEGQAQTWIPHETHNKRLQQTLPSSTSSQGSRSFTVLPPIGEPVRGKTSEQSCGQKMNPGCPVQRSSSDGYLDRMEKQRQMRARAIDKKLKRQTLFSQVIREPNKKLSRIPFSVTKDPEGKDKEVPRLKALKYAKTIVKPPLKLQARAKEKHQSEGFTERAPHVEGLDVSQLATLDLLRKRHEEEKRAVALFGKVHVA